MFNQFINKRFPGAKKTKRFMVKRKKGLTGTFGLDANAGKSKILRGASSVNAWAAARKGH